MEKTKEIIDTKIDHEIETFESRQPLNSSGFSIILTLIILTLCSLISKEFFLASESLTIFPNQSMMFNEGDDDICLANSVFEYGNLDDK